MTFTRSSKAVAASSNLTGPDDFTAYSVGLCFASACTNLDDTEATRTMNHLWPTGLASQWEIHDGPFAGGEPNPCPCNTHADTHRHVLFSC